MTQKLSTKIYDSIKDEIVTGKIDSREFLNEGKLAQQYSVSKAPVREALHLLCDQGLLISYPRKGYMINILVEDDINEIQVIRAHMEKLSVDLTIDNASDEEIASLRKYTAAESNTTDPDLTNNSRFHMRLAEISHNKYLPELLQNLVSKASLYGIHLTSDMSSHDQIIDALLARNKKLAEKYIDEDIREV